MSTLNRKSPAEKVFTHEGAAVAKVTNAEEQLRRTVMACMLWEKTFYEDGEDIATRIMRLIPHVSPERCTQIAIEARSMMKLRHVPLLIVRQMARLDSHKYLVAKTLHEIIQRPDELCEFLAIYWKDDKEVLSAQVKKGLASAFTKFNEYSLAKYDQDHDIKLRDVLFLVHSKPTAGVAGYTKAKRKRKHAVPSDEGSQLYHKLVTGTMAVPDTWETALSADGNTKEAWDRLIDAKKLGGLALIRNLRNMTEKRVSSAKIKAALAEMKTDRILPFRFIAAARYVPGLEPDLEAAMFKCLADKEKIPGKTKLVIDVSGSMDDDLSAKSDMKRFDAAYGLAILAREVCEDVDIYSFSDRTIQIPARHGFALRDAIHGSQQHGGTMTGEAVSFVNRSGEYDRIIIITDEQSHDAVPKPKGDAKGYIINVADYKNGIGYGQWTHIHGWSEAVLDFIRLYEEGDRREASRKEIEKSNERRKYAEDRTEVSRGNSTKRIQPNRTVRKRK